MTAEIKIETDSVVSVMSIADVQELSKRDKCKLTLVRLYTIFLCLVTSICAAISIYNLVQYYVDPEPD